MITTTLASVLTKVTVLFLCAWLATACMRRSAATLRHLVWAASLLGALAIPVVECGPGLAVLPSFTGVDRLTSRDAAEADLLNFVPKWQEGPDVESPIVPARSAPALAEVTAPRPATADAAAAAGDPDQATTENQVAPGAGSNAGTSLAAPSGLAGLGPAGWSLASLVLRVVWIGGMIFFVIRLVHGWLVVRRIVGHAVQGVDDRLQSALTKASSLHGVRRRVSLLLCSRRSGPMTWGVLRPVVILPAGAESWAQDRIDAVLLHELAHVARFDCLSQFLGRLARIIYWFHPLAWLAMQKLHLEQERACDDSVLRAGFRASAYAQDLMEIASDLRPVPAAALVSTAIARPSELMARMQYLLDATQVRTPPAPWARRTALVGSLLLAAILGAARPQEAAAARRGQDVQDKQDKQKLARRLVGLLDLPSHRDQAITELAALGAPALAALTAAMHDERATVVDGALAALTKSRAPRAEVVPVLLSVFADPERDGQLRVKAAGYLGPRLDEEPRIFAAFLAVHEESGSADLALAVIHHLSGSQVHREQVAKLLTRVAAKPPEKTAEELAAEEQKNLIGRLINALDFKALRAGAFNRLKPLRVSAYTELTAALRDPRPLVRNGVMQLLVYPTPVDRGVARSLIGLLTDPTTTAPTRNKIATHLAHCMVSEADVIDEVLAAVQAKTTSGKKELVESLTRVPRHQYRITMALEKLMSGRSDDLALWIVSAVSKMQANDAVRARILKRALDSERPDIVAQGIRGLSSATQYDEATTKRVAALVGHPDAAVRRATEDYTAARKMRENFEMSGLIVADYSDNRVVEFDANGKEVFVIDEIFGVWDVEALANGNLLLTEFSVNRVSEVTRDKEVVWQFEQLKNPYDADRLENGNTLIADTFGRRVIEVDPKGKIVWKYDTEIHPYDVDRLPNGNTLIADTHKDRVIEVNPKGEIVWKVENVPNVHDADRLANGNTLLTIRMLNEVREVDRDGKVVWRIGNLSSPSDADRLPNGATMVAENGFIRVFAPDGSELWKKAMTWAVEVNLAPPRK